MHCDVTLCAGQALSVTPRPSKQRTLDSAHLHFTHLFTAKAPFIFNVDIFVGGRGIESISEHFYPHCGC